MKNELFQVEKVKGNVSPSTKRFSRRHRTMSSEALNYILSDKTISRAKIKTLLAGTQRLMKNDAIILYAKRVELRVKRVDRRLKQT